MINMLIAYLLLLFKAYLLLSVLIFLQFCVFILKFLFVTLSKSLLIFAFLIHQFFTSILHFFFFTTDELVQALFRLLLFSSFILLFLHLTALVFLQQWVRVSFLI